MTGGYYRSQDMEASETACHPTCQEALDAYIAPLFLEKARLAKLPVPEYYITDAFFEPPVLIDTMNPFQGRESVVRKAGREEALAHSLTRNATYAICCQKLPEGSQVRRVRTVMGWTASLRYRPLAADVWRVFWMPLATLRLIDTPDGRLLLSGMSPLPFESLKPTEAAYLNKVVAWQA
jgi:hypothetical protein